MNLYLSKNRVIKGLLLISAVIVLLIGLTFYVSHSLSETKPKQSKAAAGMCTVGVYIRGDNNDWTFIDDLSHHCSEEVSASTVNAFVSEHQNIIDSEMTIFKYYKCDYYAENDYNPTLPTTEARLAKYNECINNGEVGILGVYGNTTVRSRYGFNTNTEDLENLYIDLYVDDPDLTPFYYGTIDVYNNQDFVGSFLLNTNEIISPSAVNMIFASQQSFAIPSVEIIDSSIYDGSPEPQTGPLSIYEGYLRDSTEGPALVAAINQDWSGTHDLYIYWVDAINVRYNIGTSYFDRKYKYSGTITLLDNDKVPSNNIPESKYVIGWYYDSGFENPASSSDSYATLLTLPYVESQTYPIKRINVYAETANKALVTCKVSTDGSTYSTYYVIPGSKITLPDPSMAGYTFVKWVTTQNGTTDFDFNQAINSDTTIWSNWTPDTYDITFGSGTTDPNSVSNLPSNTTKTHGVDFIIPDVTPARDGWRFDYWCTLGCASTYHKGDVYTANAPLALYAHWVKNTIQSYSVTFDKNTTDSVTNMPLNGTKTQGVNYPIPNNVPVREGYSFSGWCTETNGTGTCLSPGGSYTTDAEVILYAKWEETIVVNYIIDEDIHFTKTFTYNADDLIHLYSNVEDTPSHHIELAPTEIINALGNNRYVDGWYLNSYYQYGVSNKTYSEVSSFIQIVDGVRTLTLYGKVYNYPVVLYYYLTNGEYYLMDRKQVSNESYSFQEYYNLPANKTFIEWNTQPDGQGTSYKLGQTYNIQAHTSVYSILEDKTCTVTFDSNGGDEIASQTVNYSGTATLPTEPTRIGYRFAGWYLENDENAFDFDTYITDDITLTAHWTEITYTVTFNSNGGSEVASQTVKYGNEAAEPAVPTRTGYRFAGWHLGNAENEYDFNTVLTGDITLTAHWTEIKYTVTFNSNGGDEIASQTVNYGGTAALPTEPTRIGYRFAGWYLGNAENPYDFDTVLTGDITLTAHWNQIKYFVTFNSDGGSSVSRQIVNYGGKALKPANPTKDCYAFAGWYLGNAENPYDFNTVLTGDITLTAHWDEAIYTITYDMNGGTGTAMDNSTSDGSGKITLKSNTYSAPIGKVFKEWNSKANGRGTHYAAGSQYSFNSNTTLYAIWVGINDVTNTPLVSNSLFFNDKTGVSGVNINADYTYKVLDNKGVIKTTGNIGTGDVIEFYLGSNQMFSYEVVVSADVNGDARISMMDYMMIKNYLVGKTNLTGLYLEAADVNQDDKISMMDYMKVRYYLVNN